MTRILAVARKEIIDSVRDRRTLLVMLLTAVAAGPLLLMLVMHFAASQADHARALRLPVIGADRAPALIAFFQRQQVEIVAAPADFEAAIRRGELSIAMIIDEQFASQVAKGQPAVVQLVYDRSRDRARLPIEQTEALLRAYNREWGQGRLLLRGIAPEVASPLRVDARDLATPQSSGSLVLFMIAYYGLFACVLGGMAAAIDATAGERERQSLEPLLITPLRPLELATGKWIAVVLLAAAVVVVTLAGFYLILRYGPLPSIGIPFLFGGVEFARFLLVLAPLVLLMPAILLYVGARGRTFKEAQANGSVVIFIVSIIPVLQLIMQWQEPEWLRFVPIASQYSLLGRALRGEGLPWMSVAASYAAPVVLTMLALLGLARRFSREGILAGR